MKKYRSVRGMKDLVGNEASQWLNFEKIIRDWTKTFSYDYIRTPILENTNLFIRSIGEATDIVEKEMYTFIDNLNNESLTLRPEGTVATLRACIENNLLYQSNQRLWYMGPMFRHERPQKGRYRQFHQVGIEALGFEGPDIDAEMCFMVYLLWGKLKIKNVELQINTIGNVKERNLYKEELIKYFEKYKSLLDEDSLRRLYKNPLRILDTKNPDLQDICNSAPNLKSFLTKDSLQHYDEWKDALTSLNVPFIENDRLVRGLDYYNNSVFEWVHKKEDKELTICAGGRYNGLMEELGGNDLPSIGFALGIERVVELCESIENEPIDVYIAHEGEKSTLAGMLLAKFLRINSYSVRQDFSRKKFKQQIKNADKLNCKYIIFIGEDEINNNKITLKNLQTGESQSINNEIFKKNTQNYLIK